MRRGARDDSPRRICDRDRRRFIFVRKSIGRRACAAAWPGRGTDSDSRDLRQDVRGARGAAGRGSGGIHDARDGALRAGFSKFAFFAARKITDGAGTIHRDASQRRRREPGFIRDAAAGPRGARSRRAGARRRHLHRRSETPQHHGDDTALCRDGAALWQPVQGNARGGTGAGVEESGGQRRALEPVPELQERDGDAARDDCGAAGPVDSHRRGSCRDGANRERMAAGSGRRRLDRHRRGNLRGAGVRGRAHRVAA